MKKTATKFIVAMASLFFAQAAFAEEAVKAAGGESDKGLIALGAGLAVGIAALGGALGQAKAAASALDGIARNPAASGKIFTPMIIALALIESLVIYALVVSILLNMHLS